MNPSELSLNKSASSRMFSLCKDVSSNLEYSSVPPEIPDETINKFLPKLRVEGLKRVPEIGAPRSGKTLGRGIFAVNHLAALMILSIVHQEGAKTAQCQRG